MHNWDSMSDDRIFKHIFINSVIESLINKEIIANRQRLDTSNLGDEMV